MRFDRKDDHVDRPNGPQIAGRLGMRGEVAARAPNAHARRLQRFELRAAREQGNVAAAARQRCARVCTDGTRSNNGDLHAGTSASKG